MTMIEMRRGHGVAYAWLGVMDVWLRCTAVHDMVLSDTHDILSMKLIVVFYVLWL